MPADLTLSQQQGAASAMSPTGSYSSAKSTPFVFHDHTAEGESLVLVKSTPFVFHDHAAEGESLVPRCLMSSDVS